MRIRERDGYLPGVIVLGGDQQLDLDTYWRVVADHEPVTIEPAALAHVDDRRRAMEEHLEAGAPAYGVTTGLGHMATRAVPKADQPELQRAIIVGRAAGVGPPYDESIVRGTMLVRLNGFLAGYTGVTRALCTFLADRLNDGWFPVVPNSRPGVSGETIPLCHLFQTFIGEGEVFVAGERVAAGERLAACHLQPYSLELKEGLALVNGAPMATALAARLLHRAEPLLETATDLGALTASLMGASWRPYSTRLAVLKGDPGQAIVTDRLAALVATSVTERDRDGPYHDVPQAPVSLRVLPQVHGAVHDVLAQMRNQLERELTAVTDSPLFLDGNDVEPLGFYPNGNFHSQGLAFALDSTTVAMAQLASLSERRLHRLLDSRYSSLPDQLSADAARGGSGLVSLHKTVVGLCVENRLLATPATIHSTDTSSGQEDVQAFEGIAASQLDRLLDNVELVLAAEAIAARQASELRHGDDRRGALPPALGELTSRIAAAVPFVDRDRSLAPDLEAAAALVRDGRLRATDP